MYPGDYHAECLCEHLETRRRIEIKHLVLTSALECFSSAVGTRERREGCRDVEVLPRNEHVNITHLELSMSQECSAEDVTKSQKLKTRAFIFTCISCGMKSAVLCRHKQRYSLSGL